MCVCMSLTPMTPIRFLMLKLWSATTPSTCWNSARWVASSVSLRYTRSMEKYLAGLNPSCRMYWEGKYWTYYGSFALIMKTFTCAPHASHINENMYVQTFFHLHLSTGDSQVRLYSHLTSFLLFYSYKIWGEFLSISRICFDTVIEK